MSIVQVRNASEGCHSAHHAAGREPDEDDVLLCNMVFTSPQGTLSAIALHYSNSWPPRRFGLRCPLFPANMWHADHSASLCLDAQRRISDEHIIQGGAFNNSVPESTNLLVESPACETVRHSEEGASVKGSPSQSCCTLFSKLGQDLCPYWW